MTRPGRRRRVWCEASDLSSITDEGVLRPLALRGVELIAAVFPHSMGQVGALLGACERLGVAVSLWPMLGDDEGRWANAATMPAYAGLLRRVLGHIEARPVATIFVDLEPPIARVKAALRGPAGLGALLGAGGFDEATALLVEVAGEAAARGRTLSAAALPLMAPGGRSARGWSRALGVPLSGVPWEAVHLMMYSSLFEGYSGGALGPRVCGDLVALTARGAARAWGPRAALSLGVVGPGALGDERPLSGVEALRRDVAAARSQGVDDLALFDLLGALRRPPLTSWLDALCDEPDRAALGLAPEARALAGLCWGGGALLEPLARGRPGR